MDEPNLSELVGADEVPIMQDGCFHLITGIDGSGEAMQILQCHLHVHIGDHHMEPMVFIPEPVFRNMNRMLDLMTVASDGDTVHVHVSHREVTRIDGVDHS